MQLQLFKSYSIVSIRCYGGIDLPPCLRTYVAQIPLPLWCYWWFKVFNIKWRWLLIDDDDDDDDAELTHSEAESSGRSPLREGRWPTVRCRQIPFVFAARRVWKAAHVERSLVAEEVERAFGMWLVREVVLPESVDLIGRHRLVFGPVEIARSLVRQVHSAAAATSSSTTIR